MKNKDALNHIINRGTNSRTILFNAIMASLTTFFLAVSIHAEEQYPILVAILPPTLTLISSLGNIVLYGMTHVKHEDKRNGL